MDFKDRHLAVSALISIRCSRFRMHGIVKPWSLPMVMTGSMVLIRYFALQCAPSQIKCSMYCDSAACFVSESSAQWLCTCRTDEPHPHRILRRVQSEIEEWGDIRSAG